MNKRRKLTAAEKRQIREARIKSELALHPKSRITVDVDDETDDEGNAVIRVRRITF